MSWSQPLFGHAEKCRAAKISLLLSRFPRGSNSVAAYSEIMSVRHWQQIASECVSTFGILAHGPAGRGGLLMDVVVVVVVMVVGVEEVVVVVEPAELESFITSGV